MSEVSNASSPDIQHDVIYVATLRDHLCTPETDARCIIVAYDDPIEAVKHYQDQPLCTLFAIKQCHLFKQIDKTSEDGKANDTKKDKVLTPTRYIYTGRGTDINAITVMQKISLSPTNYLHDWYQMNRLINYNI